MLKAFNHLLKSYILNFQYLNKKILTYFLKFFVFYLPFLYLIYLFI